MLQNNHEEERKPDYDEWQCLRMIHGNKEPFMNDSKSRIQIFINQRKQVSFKNYYLSRPCADSI